MVQDSRTATGAGRLRPLNAPASLAVEAGPRGMPKAVVLRGLYRPVVAVHDSWRIDDEWWREEISRRYFLVELEGGRRFTIYHDLVRDAWNFQPYEAPKAKAG
jgi:hypothetical protein